MSDPKSSFFAQTGQDPSHTTTDIAAGSVEVTPVGGLTATDAQAAFEELDAEVSALGANSQPIYLSAYATSSNGNGVTDDTAVWTAALAAAAGRTLIITHPTVEWFVDGNFTPAAGTRIIAEDGYPAVKMRSASNSKLFEVNADHIEIKGLYIDGNKSVTPTQVLIRLNGATKCKVHDLVIVNAPSAATGSIVLSGSTTDNLVDDIFFESPELTAVGCSGSGVTRNHISRIGVLNGGGFGLRFGEGANRNTFSDIRAIDCALEGVATTFGSDHNYGSSCYTEGAGDNGFSLSGAYNILMNCSSYGVAAAGVGIFGSDNVVIGGEHMNCNQSATAFWSGVTIIPGFGGAGQRNTVHGVMVDDDQGSPTTYNGVRVHALAYTLWAAGQVITSGTYRYYGLNIYISTTSGTTGATPPTHTTGTASDGAVTWSYVNSFITVAQAAYNTLGPNTVRRTQSAAFFDANDWATNVLIDRTANYHPSLKHVMGGGIESSLTSLNHLTIRNTSNTGVILESGSSSLARYAFGDSVLAGATEYDHALDELSLMTAGATKRIRARASGVVLGSPTGGFAAADSLNAAGGLYDNGRRVYPRFAQQNTQVSHTGDTNETAKYTVTIPANTMGANGKIRVRAEGTCTNSANNKTLRIRMSGLLGTQLFGALITTNGTWQLEAEIHNRNATNVQRATGRSHRSTDGLQTAQTPVDAALDTTTALDLVLSVQLANSGETITVETVQVDVLPAA